jgi:hypothetical protein
MAFRSSTIAIKQAKQIAKDSTIDNALKENLVTKVLDVGQAAAKPPRWDRWAQRIVAGGLGVIGVAIAVFVGVATLMDEDLNAAFLSALAAVIAGLAGMFSQQVPSKDEGTKDEGTKDEGTKDEGTKDEGTKDEGTKDEVT